MHMKGWHCKRRVFLWLLACISLGTILSCGEKPDVNKRAGTDGHNEVQMNSLQGILDSADVAGAILIFDPQEDTYYANSFEMANEGHLPASTFKIPNSIIALELGTVEDDSTMLLWDGQPRLFDIWEKDMTFREAFTASCYPCYQELTVRAGYQAMKNELKKLKYPSMIFDSLTLHEFWLEGESKVNCYEQIEFLYNFNSHSLPISDRTHNLVKDMMVLSRKAEYTLFGKTGWSITDNVNNGWFVGFLEVGPRHYYFSTNITPKESFDMQLFPRIRRTVTEDALSELKLL